METFDFAFKGHRTYIQGGDLYNAISKYLRERFGNAISRVELSFHGLVSHVMVGEVLDGDTLSFPYPPPVVCHFTVGDARKVMYLAETDREIIHRQDYDEDSIVRASQILPDEKSIAVLNQTAYSPIEVIIALNKRLMQSIFQLDKGKWLFTRLSLPSLLPERSTVHYMIEFAGGYGHHLTRSKITIEDERCGDIYFTLVRG